MILNKQIKCYICSRNNKIPEMDKRTFLKNSAILTLGGAVVSSLPGSLASAVAKGSMAGEKYILPELDYAYDALEPYIDAMTMEIHYSKHHAGYTRKFNAALESAGLTDVPIKELFKKASQQSEAIRNNGGGYYNHKVFWKCLSPNGGGPAKGDVGKAIEKNFGSFDKFRELFSNAAATRFGSGWAWLVKTGNGLAVSSTPNQDNPLMDVADQQGYPLLAIDVWEHAYYLKYQNRRTDYIAAFWNLVNWDYVNERLNKAGK
jgi:Fe-Mn family superoxide dismutase